MLQELLTYAIEFVAIGGFGGILAHYITQNCISVPVPQSSSQQDDTLTRDALTRSRMYPKRIVRDKWTRGLNPPLNCLRVSPSRRLRVSFLKPHQHPLLLLLLLNRLLLTPCL
jgi:hypothetical protein